MAITLIAAPDNFSPAYNHLKHIYDSTNKNLDGFRYVFDVYQTGGSKIAEYRVLPRITDGYGEIDLSRLLQNYVTYVYPSGTNEIAVANSAYQYTLKIGEEYVTTFSYTASVVQDGIYVEITPTVAHSFVVGDRVVITQADGGVANPNLEGLFTVTAVNGTTSFTVNSLWSEVTDATINGEVRYSDNRKTVTRDIRTETAAWVYDGAIKPQDFRSYDGSVYLLNAVTDKFLTTMPREMWITPTQDLFVLTGNNNVTTGNIRFQDSNGSFFNYNVTNNDIVTLCNVGANNSTALDPNTIDYYDFWFAGASPTFTQQSEKIRVYIDQRCKINDYEILFYDRLGSWGSFAFQLKDYKRGTVTKEVYNQDLIGSVASAKWTYDTYEFGSRVVFPAIDETLELNTNWMTEDMAEYFSELVSSPQTYIKIGSTYLACIVQDTSYEIERQRNKNLIRKTITVKLANQTPING